MCSTGNLNAWIHILYFPQSSHCSMRVRVEAMRLAVASGLSAYDLKDILLAYQP